MTAPIRIPVLQGSPEWLAARREHVTATDLPALLGISPYRCEQDVADEKLSGTDAESTLVMRVGSALEDLIAAQYAEQTGRKVRRVRGLWESRRVPWAAASPDATAAGRLVELKWTGSRARFRDGLPEDVEAQVAWQLFVAEADECDVATLTVGDDAIRVFTVRADEGLQRHLVAIAADFRRRLAAGGPFAQSAESLKRKHPADDGTELAADAEMAEAVRALIEVRDRIGALKGTEETLEVAIKTRMADAATLLGDGWRVTWKRTKDRTTTDWHSLAEGLLSTIPADQHGTLLDLYTRTEPGFRPFRVSLVGDKE